MPIRPTNLIERMYDDLASVAMSARTSEEEIYERYGRGPCWLGYKIPFAPTAKIAVRW